MSGRLAIAANLWILGALGLAGWLNATDPAAFYAMAQEDRALEWMSFWSFFAAAAVFAVAAHRWRRAGGGLQWFLIGLAAFCAFVAMEEISWGQRVFGLRPPDYFLAENYQQETNLHNIASKDLRLGVFRAIILGYGVLLPLVALFRPAARLLDRLRIVPPPIELSPAMFGLFWVHLQYPWKFTGEVVEFALGFAFLFAAMALANRFSEEPRGLVRAAALPGAVVLLGFASSAWSQNRESTDPLLTALARSEVEALKNDFANAAKGGEEVTKCNLHKRVYTFVSKNPSAQRLARGSFAIRIARGMPEARAEFFLDPWNSPYWVRDRCDDDGRRVILIYSFGPNRSRDSSHWEIRGDDIGEYVLRRPEPADGARQ